MTDRVTIITGAGGGIGEAVSRRLAGAGHGVGLLDLGSSRIGAIADARRSNSRLKKREYFERALDYLRQARQLFEDELVETPRPSERQRNLELEIARLDAKIERTHRDRPID